ncbi:hypothetical protein Tco_0896952 [Tanacetum coccineum]
MSTLTFPDTHNMVAFLEKPAESDGFHEIIDFLNANQIHYALTVNPTIYTSCIEQFWATAKVKTVNGERQIQALVDKKKVIITETSIRSDLHLEDADGTDCLPTATIFEELARMGDSTADVPNKEHVPMHSNNPLLSGEDRMKLIELMDMCTKLSERVLDLDHTKTAQAQEITNLKLRVKKLDKKAGFRTHNFKRLYKVGVTRRVESSYDESLGAQEDASKQGRSRIEAINRDVEVTLVETQRMNDENDDNLMFDTGVFDGDEIVVETEEPVIIAAIATKSIPTIPQESQPSKIKDKGKAIMIEPEVPLKRKDQVALDEDLARNLQAPQRKQKVVRRKLKAAKKEILGKKRAGKGQQQESSKRQRIEDDKETDEHEEVEVVDDAELKKHLVIVKDDDIAINAIPLATKPPVIVEYKLLKEGIMVHYQLIRADEVQRYSSKMRCFKVIGQKDLQTLWKLVKTKHGDTRPEDEHERVL